MADILLSRPEAGVQQVLTAAPDSRFVFEFPAAEALMERSGDNLVFTFEDGGSLVLENFYTAYSRENMPDFSVDGVEISGADFFAALDSSLMPAAGPAAGPAAPGGTRYREWDSMNLYDGLDRLGGLDVGFNDAGEEHEDLWGGGDPGDLGVSIVPTDAALGDGVVTVREEDLDSGNPVVRGSLDVIAPDGVERIEVRFEGQAVSVPLDGSAVTLPTHDEGEAVFRWDEATSRLHYSYELKTSTREHGGEGKDGLSHDIAVTVTDKDGSTGSTVIRVTIVDDVPQVWVNPSETAEESHKAVVDMGADDRDVSQVLVSADEAGTRIFFWNDGTGERADLTEMAVGETWTREDGVMTVTANSDGSYAFVLAPDTNEVHTIHVTAVDADGDRAVTDVTLKAADINIPPADPNAPDNPDTPDTPDNPDNPNNPDVPDTPLNPEAGRIESQGAHIVTDEGALQDGSGQHTAHGAAGSGSFTVDVHDEIGGSIVLSCGTDTVTLTIPTDRSVTQITPTGATSLTVHGVAVTVTGATLTEAGWQVSYTYALTDNQEHDGASPSEGEGDVLGGAIDIRVTDGTGDVVNAALRVEVHDDVPVVQVVDADAQRVRVTFGADNEDAALRRVQVLDAEGKPMEWRAGNDTTADLDGMAAGDRWTDTAGLVNVTREDNGDYTFTIAEDGGAAKAARIELTVQGTDADGDTHQQNLVLDAPTFPVPGTTDPDDPNPTPDPDDPDNPDSGSTSPHAPLAEHVVDESGLADGSTPGKALTNGTGSFKVHLNNEAGTIQVGEVEITVDADGSSSFGAPTFVTEHGVQVTVTGATLDNNGLWTVNYTYELTDEQNHPDKADPDDTLSDTVAVLVTDVAGETAKGAITITIKDDGPTVELAGDEALQAVTVNFGADDTHAPVRLEVFNNNQPWEWEGADSADPTNLSGLSVGTTWNSTDNTVAVTRTEDGEYAFKILTEDRQLDLYVQATDADGDVAGQNLTLKAPTIIPVDPQNPNLDPDSEDGTVKPDAAANTMVMDETGLATGSNTTLDSVEGRGEFTVNLNNESGTIQVGAVRIEVEKDDTAWAPAANTLIAEVYDGAVSVYVAGATKNAQGLWTVNYTYTLNHALPHRDDTDHDDVHFDAAGSIPITVTDTSGEKAEGRLDVKVHDDGPVITKTTAAYAAHAADTERGTLEGIFTVDYGADGAAGTALQLTYVEGTDSVELVFNNGSYTGRLDEKVITVNPKDTDAFGHPQFSYTVEYDSTTIKEGFDGTLNIIAEDGDGDTVQTAVAVKVVNTAPNPMDDTYDLHKSIVGESTISASASAALPGSMIVVGGTSELNESNIHWKHGESSVEKIEAGYDSDRLFGDVFVDLGGNNLTIDQLADAAHIYVFDPNKATPGQFKAAVEYASTNNLLLYVKGDLAIEEPIDLNCVTVVKGNLHIGAGIHVNSYLYVSGNATANANFDVSGGLAVQGNLTAAPNITVNVDHTADIFTPDNVIVSQNVPAGEMPSASLTIRMADLPANDSDPDGHAPDHDGLEIASITLGGRTFIRGTDVSDHPYSQDTSVSIDWDNGLISVTNTGPRSEAVRFDYTVRDFHGAEETASVTVNVTANVGAGSMGDDLIQGATNTVNVGETHNIVIIFDRSGSMEQEIDTASDAVCHLITTLQQQANETNSKVTVKFISFDGDADNSYVPVLLSDSNAVKVMTDAIEGIKCGSGTNYYKPFKLAYEWLGAQNLEGAKNQIYFITDGEPNKDTTLHDAVYNNLIGLGNVTFKAVGIGSDTNLKDRLVKYDSDGKPLMVENAEGLKQTLQYLVANKPFADTVPADAGDDVVFGDTAELMLDGTEVAPAAYVQVKLGHKPDTADVMEYIREYAVEINEALVVNTNEKTPDQPDILLGGEGNDVIFGQGGNDLIFGDGDNAAGTDGTIDRVADLVGTQETDPETLSTAVHGAMKAEAEKGDALDTLVAELESLESDSDGNDLLFGGNGADVLFGGGGNDYLLGGNGEDVLFGGSGNDILVYDQNDVMIVGGSGIDFMVAEDDDLSLETLLNGTGAQAPVVDGVEVLLTGNGVINLTDTAKLAEYGITLNADGTELTLSADWTASNSEGTFTNEGADLTLQIDTTALEQKSGEADEQVFILSTQQA